MSTLRDVCMIDHKNICDSCQCVVDDEQVAYSALKSLPKPITRVERCGWLNETELTSRLKEGLGSAVPAYRSTMKMEGSGRAGAFGHRADIICTAYSPPTRIEVVYMWSKTVRQPGMPPKTLEEDLVRLDNNQADHVVAFAPPVRTGYGVPNRGTFDIGGNALTLGSDELLFGNCIKMNTASQIVADAFSGISQDVPSPAAGTKTRWSLSAAPVVGQTTITFPQCSVLRSVVGDIATELWCIVWSRTTS